MLYVVKVDIVQLCLLNTVKPVSTVPPWNQFSCSEYKGVRL